MKGIGIGKRYKNLKEFSKQFIYIATFVWVMGAIFGGMVISSQLIAMICKPEVGMSIDLNGYLTYLAIPLSCGVVAYMAKAAFENANKINQGYDPEYVPKQFDNKDDGQV